MLWFYTFLALADDAGQWSALRPISFILDSFCFTSWLYYFRICLEGLRKKVVRTTASSWLESHWGSSKCKSSAFTLLFWCSEAYMYKSVETMWPYAQFTKPTNHSRDVPVCAVSLQSIHFIAAYMWWDVFIARHPAGALALRRPSAASSISTSSSAIASFCHFSILNFKELNWKTIIWGNSPTNHHRWVCQSCNIWTTWRNHNSYYCNKRNK